MRRTVWWGTVAIGVNLLVLLEPGCVGDAPVFPEPDGGTAVDAGAGAGAAPDVEARPPCDPSSPFTAIEMVTELSAATDDEAPRLTPDELTMYFTRRAGMGHPYQIFWAKRGSRDIAFGAATPLLLLANASGAMIAPDQTTLYYGSDRGGADPNAHLYMAKAPFSAATSTALSELNWANSDDYAPYVNADDTELYFVSRRPAGADDNIYVGVRQGGAFAVPTAIAAVNSPSSERSPVISADGLRLYFGSNRAKVDDYDIYVATRSVRSEPFGDPAPIAALNTSSLELPDWIAPDECTLYFRSDRPGGAGGRDVWRARRR